MSWRRSLSDMVRDVIDCDSSEIFQSFSTVAACSAFQSIQRTARNEWPLLLGLLGIHRERE